MASNAQPRKWRRNKFVLLPEAYRQRRQPCSARHLRAATLICDASARSWSTVLVLSCLTHLARRSAERLTGAAICSNPRRCPGDCAEQFEGAASPQRELRGRSDGCVDQSSDVRFGDL